MERLRLLGFRQVAVLSCLAMAFTSAAWGSPGFSPARHSSDAGKSAPADASLTRASIDDTRPVILVVGDSLVAQSTAALESDSSAAAEVRIAGRLGTAPCDWTGGDFTAALKADHPAVVVLAFTGNAGAAVGCIGNGAPRAYPLADLLANYRASLTKLADEAEAAGATVVFSTPPARNPAAPSPPDVPTAKERKSFNAYYGFQGVPQIRNLYAEMVTSSAGRWRLSDAAALAVSPNFAYTQTLSCEKSDGSCPQGTVDVRAGGDDAIHLDAAGHGAKRFAAALVASVLPDSGPVILAKA